MEKELIKHFADIKEFKREFRLDKQQLKLLTQTLNLSYVINPTLKVAPSNTINLKGRKEYYLTFNYSIYRVNNKKIRELLKDYSTNERILKIGLCYKK